MAVIGVILVVLFVILAIFLVALVLLQNGEGEGLGGLFAGSSNSAFGSRSASVLTKVTYVCVGLFFVLAFFLALVNKTPSDRGFQEEVQMRRATETRENWWADDQAGAGDAAVEEAGEDAPEDGIEEAGEVMQGDAAIEEAGEDATEDGITSPDGADEVVQDGAVIEEADGDTPEDGITRPDDADEVTQAGAEMALPEEPGETLQNAEVDTMENTDAALRPD